MRKNPKGELTKEKILITAKKLFYENGYKKTMMKDIAEQSNIAPGNLTYYFPTKDSLVDYIYNDYHRRIINFTENNIIADNYFTLNYYSSIIYYTNILNDINTKQFYYDIISKRTTYSFLSENVHYLFHKIIEDFGMQIKKKKYKYLTLADAGARHQILLNYLKEQNNMPIIDLIIIINENTAKLFGIKENVYFKSSIEVYRNINKYDFSHIKLLI